jgi:DsbC/DsbD-like thiol-disulfide interchange protein
MINYGYTGDVVLPARLHRPEVTSPASPARIAATVKWLVCRDMCLPGKADLEMDLPVAQDTAETTNWRTLIEGSLARVPKPAPVSWQSRVVEQGGNLVLSVDSGARESKAEFFPLEPGQVDEDAPIQSSSTPTGVTFTMRKSDQLSRLPASLRGVVVLGEGRGFVIDAPFAGR